MRGVRAGVVAVVAVLTVGGCSSSGSDGSGSTKTGASTGAPEDRTTSAAAVAEGLAKLSTLGEEIAAKTVEDAAEGKDAAEGLEPLWEPIEGTVKKNDPDTYLAIEDSFANLESGDSTKATTGAKDLATAISAYLAKYPG